MTKAPRDTHGSRKVKRGKKERKREGERVKKKKEKGAGVPSYEQTSRDTLSIPFRNTPEGKEGRGRKGVKFSAGSNEPRKCFGRSDHVEASSQLELLRSRNGMSQLGIQECDRSWQITLA